MASSLLALGLPIVVLQVYDRVLPNQSGATLLVLTVTLAVIVLLDLGLRLLRADLTAWAAAQYEHRLGLQLSRTMLRAPMNLVDRDGGAARPAGRDRRDQVLLLRECCQHAARPADRARLPAAGGRHRRLSGSGAARASYPLMGWIGCSTAYSDAVFHHA
jgi:hypothetical protein